MVKRIVSVWRIAFPDLRFTVDLIVAEGDLVMCGASFEGTHLGELQLIPPLKDRVCRRTANLSKLSTFTDLA